MYEENKNFFFSVFNVNIKGYLFVFINLNYVICGLNVQQSLKKNLGHNPFVKRYYH